MVAASAAGCFAESLPQLIVARFLQALGGATGMVVSRAIIRDLYSRDRIGAMISLVLRARLEYIKYKRPDFSYDTIQFNDLLLAPFKLKNVFTPITGGFILAALAELYFEGRNASQTISDVNQMYFMNRFIDRNTALPIYGTLSLALSWGAGISEEYLFRNGIMPLWDYEYGQSKGLVYSSLFFGSLHFSNVLFSNNPDYKAALLQVAETSIAGYFLGRDVQNRDYRIGPAVAAHTWYDFILMAGSFLVDPKNNVFGVNVKFVIN